MNFRKFALAGAVILTSAAAAQAAIVENDLNLRSGPGTNYRVIDTMPAGANVAVLNCGGGWCRVVWRGVEGFASRSYLTNGGPAYAYSPPIVVPRPYYGARFGTGHRWRHQRHHRRWR